MEENKKETLIFESLRKNHNLIRDGQFQKREKYCFQFDKMCEMFFPSKLSHLIEQLIWILLGTLQGKCNVKKDG